MNKELRPHQVKAMEMLRASLTDGCRRPMLQAPTGSGKTMIAAAIVEGAMNKGKRVIFTVPALSLVDQTVQAFWDEGISDIGVIQGQHTMTNWSKPIQVASVQTLMKREIPHADVVIVDEAHRFFDFHGKWLLDPAWAKRPFIGLSATPWTRGLGRYYDDLIIPTTTSELIEQGYLCPFRVYAPSHPDLSSVRTVAGDYHEGDLSGVMSKSPLVADVVKTWIERAENRSTFCFAVDRAHAKHLDDKFKAAGVETGYIDAYTKIPEREQIHRAFADGRIRVVCNVGVLTTGIDWDVRCIILARPTKSEMMFTQIIGRGLRTAEAKQDCLILDHSDTHLRLGFVTDIYHEKLDDGRERAKAKSDKVRLPKECPKCAFLRAPGSAVCPACGFKAEVVSKIKEGDGELAEFTGKKKANGVGAVDQLSFYLQLRGFAEERGYQKAHGWCCHKFKEKFGSWPPKAFEGYQGILPTPAVRSWIRSRQIAYAKAREKQGESHVSA